MLIPMPRRAGADAPPTAPAESPDAYSLRVQARELAATGRHKEAAAAWRAVLDLQFDDAGAAHQMGLSLLETNKLDEAVAAFRRAMEQDRSPALKLDLARALVKQGKHGDAKLLLDDLAAADPRNADVLHWRGLALRGLGLNDEALNAFERACELRPDHAGSQAERAETLKTLKRAVDAEAACREALRLEPDQRQAVLILGKLLVESRRAEEAVAALQRLADRHPGDVTAWTDLASALLAARDYARALLAYRAALALAPASASLLCNFALALFGLDRMDEGIAACQRALAIEPASPTAQFNMACMYLAQGRFREGWAAYQFRFPMGQKKAVREEMKAAPWCGEDLAGKSILVLGEQGNGDYIHFARYVTALSELGASVSFFVPERLKEIFRTLPGSIDVIGAIDVEKAYDYQCYLISLPHWFAQMDAPIPVRPYLHAEPERVAKWRERIGPKGFRIAVAWQGAIYEGKESVRSYPLQALQPLAALPGVRLISLQIGKGSEQIDALTGMTVERLGADFDTGEQGFLDTAAVIECADLVVSCDTSIAHLAGALGKPVWIALNESAEWRWQRKRKDSVWYLNATLFRQETRGDWDGVFAGMAEELGRMLARGRPAATTGAASPQAPISWGECLDKITILEIKEEKLTAPGALANVRRELADLKTALAPISPLSPALAAERAELARVNRLLWTIEDEIRDCEAAGRFDARFIELARSVYVTNDERARIKRGINSLTHSAIVEEKHYRPYQEIKSAS